MATFIVVPFFLEEVTVSGPITCSVTGCQYYDLLQTFVVPQQQQRWVFTVTVLIQDGAFSRIHE